MEKYQINFKIISRTNQKSYESWGTLCFQSLDEIKHYMNGYITAYKKIRKNIEMYAYDTNNNLIHKMY